MTDPADSDLPAPAVRVYPTQYLVSCFPLDDEDSTTWSVKVELRGKDRWAVLHMGYCYDIDANAEYEPLSSSRTDEFLAKFRFDLNTALDVARKVAPKLIINDLRAEDVVRWRQLRTDNPTWNREQLHAAIKQERGW